MGLLDFLFGRGGGQLDGSSPDRAVVVGSVPEEYEWLRRHFPGANLLGQSLQHLDGRPFDVLRISTAGGQEKEIYFDISGFFGT